MKASGDPVKLEMPHSEADSWSIRSSSGPQQEAGQATMRLWRNFLEVRGRGRGGWAGERGDPYASGNLESRWSPDPSQEGGMGGEKENVGDAKTAGTREGVVPPTEHGSKTGQAQMLSAPRPGPRPTCLHYCSWDLGQRPRASVSHSIVTAPGVALL